MIVKPTKLEGVWSFEPKQWGDERGVIKQMLNEADFNLATHIDMPPVDWVQENVAVSNERVLRGIHGYRDLWRLCYCVYGEIYFVVVNCKKDDEHFGEWQAFRLVGVSETILVPPELGIACLTLSKVSIFSYKWSGYYEDHEQFHYRYDDPRFGIKWPLEGEPILSERDKKGVVTDYKREVLCG